MKINNKVIALTKGEVMVYSFGEIKLHAYKTNDLINNEVFILERDGKGIIIEPPCFYENIKELEKYLDSIHVKIEAILPSYHMAGASLLKDVPVYSTKKADNFGHNGGGKALIDNFKEAFGDIFDSSIFTTTNIIEADTIKLIGIKLNIIPTTDAFDIEIPEINAVYTHMLGHDTHSIVAGEKHADMLIAQLEEFLAKNYTLVLSSHYTPEGLKDVETKISYLKDLKIIAKNNKTPELFKKAVKDKYPSYLGENYLDMTTAIFYQS